MRPRQRTDGSARAANSDPGSRACGSTIFGIPRLQPMLASHAKSPFDSDDWLFEVKWDGYRCLAYVTREGVYLDSRNGKPLLPQFPSLSPMSSLLNGRAALLDGEIVAMNSGRVDFSYLRTNPSRVTFVAFDLLFLDGELLLDHPLVKRKDLLAGVMRWGDPIALSEVVPGRGRALFEWAKEQGLEGIMAKRKESAYSPGTRSDNWLKVKNLREGRFWVLGYASSPGRSLGSLVVAEREESGYVIVGRVSSGLNREYERYLLEKLEPVSYEDLVSAAGALHGAPSRRERENVQWVRPYFGVQVDFTEMTADGRLRHPVFRDIVSEECERRAY